ncbi:MAG TPA: FAD:protein FMN transferase [bacterium]|nr:FAD:protein FMN transferase [bacterium]HEX68568.1 FAD:protein FMN transferase [bacterium]
MRIRLGKEWLISLIFLLFSLNAFATTLNETFYLMGTTVEVRMEDKGKSERQLRVVFGDLVAYLTTLSSLLDPYSDESEISRINKAEAGEEVKVSFPVYSLLKDALEISRKTNGCFDITVMPLVRLWGFFKKERKTPPTDEEIEKVLPYVGYYLIDLTPGGSVVKRESEVEIDPSGIAKGFIVDKGIEFLKIRKIKSALINAGGDLRVYGRRWRIGVAHPRFTDRILGIITLREGAVATSGDYQKFWEYGGRKYHHILDPRTGYPADSRIISATVVSSECFRADALATALVVRGEKGLTWLDKGEEALLVKGEEVKLIMSSGMKKLFKEIKSP